MLPLHTAVIFFLSPLATNEQNEKIKPNTCVRVYKNTMNLFIDNYILSYGVPGINNNKTNRKRKMWISCCVYICFFFDWYYYYYYCCCGYWVFVYMFRLCLSGAVLLLPMLWALLVLFCHRCCCCLKALLAFWGEQHACIFLGLIENILMWKIEWRHPHPHQCHGIMYKIEFFESVKQKQSRFLAAISFCIYLFVHLLWEALRPNRSNRIIRCNVQPVKICVFVCVSPAPNERITQRRKYTVACMGSSKLTHKKFTCDQFKLKLNWHKTYPNQCSERLRTAHRIEWKKKLFICDVLI